MDRPGPEFDSYEDHPWGFAPPPHQFHDRDYPPNAGGFYPADGPRHPRQHNNYPRRQDYHPGDDHRGGDDDQYHQYNAPPDDSFGGNAELPHPHGHAQANGHPRSYLPRKRRNPHQDFSDAGNYVKLFVGGVPSTVSEGDVRLVFEEYGNVLEVVLFRDKRTGHQKEYSFVKYASSEEADNAIKALHDQYIWPGTVIPIRVKYADGERDRLGALTQRKLYVNNIGKQASKDEITEVFSHYGAVEDVFLMVDEFRQSRGCGFVGFSHRDMAMAAIEGLNGSYVMRGSDRPLVVRFADPKKPRHADPRPAPCGNTSTSPAAPHMMGPDNSYPSAEHAAAYARGVTPAESQLNHIVLHQPPYQRLQSQDSQAVSQPPRPQTKPQSAGIVSAQKPAAQPAYDAIVEGIPNCDWSEHVCPDGHKYFYNCMTLESRWEKPEELALHEQKQLTLSVQPLSCAAEHSHGKAHSETTSSRFVK